MNTSEKNDQYNEILSDIKTTKIYQTIKINNLTLKGSRKKTDSRLGIILDHLDPENKKILDVGCSNGFFCYELAKMGAIVSGVDKNKEVISLNNKITKYFGLNINFFENNVDLNFFKNLSDYDVILFLSVLHHIFHHCRQKPLELCNEIIKSISKKTNLLIFEIGQSAEPFTWSKKLFLMEPDPKQWIINNLFEGSDFTNIEVVDPPAFTNGKLASMRKFIWKWNRKISLLPLSFRTIIPKTFIFLIVKMFIYDPRDTRFIFFAKK